MVVLGFLEPTIEVGRDAHDLVAHGFQGLGLATLGRLKVGGQIGQGPLDPVHAPVLGGAVQAAHHLVARFLDLAGQGLGDLFKPCGLTRTAAAFSRRQAAVEIGEGLLQLRQ